MEGWEGPWKDADVVSLSILKDVRVLAKRMNAQPLISLIGGDAPV